METERPIHQEEILGQYNFDSAQFTVNTVSTGVTETERIDSDWIGNATNHLKEREIAQQALNDEENNIRPIQFTIFGHNRSKKFKQKLFLGFLGVFVIVVIVVGVAVGLSNENENDNSANQEQEQDVNPKFPDYYYETEFFRPFKSTNVNELEDLCEAITVDEANFPQLDGVANFVTCLNDKDFVICLSNGFSTQDSCEGLDTICNCGDGDVIDARQVNREEEDLCISIDSQAIIKCVPLDNPDIDLISFLNE